MRYPQSVVIPLVLIAVCVVGCSTNESSDPSDSTAAAPATSEAITTTTIESAEGAVSADDALIEITYTGGGTYYTGDRVITEAPATMRFVNESDHGAVVVLFWYETGSSAFAEEMEFLDEGERGVPVGLPVEPYVEIELDEQLRLDGTGGLVEPGTHSWVMDLKPGTYIFDVGPEDFHDTGLWRAAVFEVTVAGSNEPSLSETIVGVWVTDRFGKYEVFLGDGSYGVGNTVVSATPVDGEAEIDSGVWSVDGNTLTRTPDASSAVCAGWVGTYEVEVRDGGDRLEITVLEDECELRDADFGSGLTRTPVVTDS